MGGCMTLRVAVIDRALLRARRIAAQIESLEFRLSPGVRVSRLPRQQERIPYATVIFEADVLSSGEIKDTVPVQDGQTTVVVWHGDEIQDSNTNGARGKWAPPSGASTLFIASHPDTDEQIGGGALKSTMYRAACDVFAWLFRPICISSRNAMFFLAPEEIRYVESKGRTLHVHGYVNATTYATLESLAKVLPDTFVRCHKSYLVNLEYVRAYTGDRLILVSGESIPVSQRKAPMTKQALLRYAHVI